MSSTLCQDFGPIRLLNCPFNSPGTTNDSQAATDNCEDNSGGSVDMSVWKACGECVPLSVLCTMYGSILSVMYGIRVRIYIVCYVRHPCTDLYCLLCTAHPDESRIWKASQAYVQNAAIRCERWLQRLGRNIITLFSLILPALFLPWLIREQVGCDLKLVEHTCLRAAPLIHVEPTIAPAPLCVCLQPVPLYLQQFHDWLTRGRLFHFPPVSKCLDLFDGSNAPFPRWICSQLF